MEVLEILIRYAPYILLGICLRLLWDRWVR